MLSIVTGYLISYFQPFSISKLGKKEIVQSTNDKHLETEVLKNEIANQQALPENKISKTAPKEKSTPSTDMNGSSANGSIQQTDDLVPQNKLTSLQDQKRIIYFNHGSNMLPDHAFKTLDQIVKFSSYHPEAEIVIEGYTDSFGNYLYNNLVTNGIPATMINTFGMGPENPVESNETFDGRKKNRRVEIKLKLK